MASTHKKALITRFDRESLEGFVQAPVMLAEGAFEVLSPDGSVLALPAEEVKAICFVRDFGQSETWRETRSFAARPKAAGLWVRVTFRDRESVEGIHPNNLLQVEEAGISIVPPDPSNQGQKLFIPRAAVAAVEVLGVIGSSARRTTKRPATKFIEEGQMEMFG